MRMSRIGHLQKYEAKTAGAWSPYRFARSQPTKCPVS